MFDSLPDGNNTDGAASHVPERPLPAHMEVQKEALMTPKAYESLAQAAERTEVSVKTLRRRIASGDLRAYRYGPRAIRLDPSDVDKLMRPLTIARRSRS